MSEDAPRSARRFRSLPPWVGPATRLLHGTREPDPAAGAVVSPIYQTASFQYPSAFSEARDHGRVHLYTRYENPTQRAAAEAVRGLEGAEDALVFGSGMGATSAALLTLLRPGDTVVALEDLYGGTVGLLSNILPEWGVQVRWVSAAEARSPEAAIPSGTRVAWIESPTNPLLRVVDLRRWAEAAHAVCAVLAVDNTFATPINQQPIRLGADLVMHSATKYLGGHTDLIAGVLAGPVAMIDRIDAVRRLLGAPLDPFAAFLLLRGMKTLPLRVARQNENGGALFTAVREHRNVAAAHYPGSRDAEEERVAAGQMTGRGGMVTLEIRGGAAGARKFLEHLRLIHVAASLGGVESLVSVPGETSHAALAPDELARRGIAPGLVRISVGIEETADLVRDVRDALDAVG